MSARVAIACRVGLFLASVALAGIAAGATVEAAVVSTLAGSGLPGFTDGARSAASFLMPVAVAYDAAGNVLVVDAAAQRIRRIRTDGSVETVAGSGQLEAGGLSVRGGFADGPGASARFNWPRGIAVANDGTIYVADTGNHCIRAVDRAGRVSVYAGAPGRAGHDLGARLQATFERPIGLALDTNGSLYVADPVAGLRRIDAGGNVVAVPLGRAPVGISVIGKNLLTLFVADADGILVANPNKTIVRMRSLNDAGLATVASFPPDPSGTIERAIVMESPVGHPQSPAALPDGSIFYGDPLTNTIRYSFPGYGFVESIAGLPAEDASGESAGFRDGADRDARFNAPLGTAVSPDARTIAIADAGNRRVRSVVIDPSADLVRASSIVPVEAAPANAYRIVYLGASWTWFDSVGRDATAGQLEQLLTAHGALAATGRVPHVRFIKDVGTLDVLESVAHTLADLSSDDLALLDITSLTADESLQRVFDNAKVWQANMTAQLRAAASILAAAHIRLVVDIHPLPIEFSANEFATSRMELPRLGGGRIPELRVEQMLKQAVLAAGVDLIDTYPDFRADALHPSEPATGTVDSHYSPHGREILARSIARGLEQLRPWSGAP